MAGYELFLAVGTAHKLRCQQTQSGKLVCNFGLRVDRYRAEGETQAVWYEVTVWERLAEVVQQYVYDGMVVMVRGLPGARHFQRKDGTIGDAVTITAREVKFLSRKSEEERQREARDFLEAWS